MEELALRQPELVGRDAELGRLRKAWEEAAAGNGRTVLVAGEAGIGKTRLVDELLSGAEGARIVRGWCLAESLEPLMPLKAALREAGMLHLISGEPPPLVVSAYLMNEGGVLMAKAEREESDLDPDIFAAMLRAVGDFVHDSLSMMGKADGEGLNALGYERYRILIQTRGALTLAAVIEGRESEFLIDDMRNTLRELGGGYDEWSGERDGELDRKVAWFVDSGKYEGRYLVDDPKIRHENVFDNVLLGLRRTSEREPIILFLDDLQWADPSTLNLLHYLARNVRNGRLLILGTYRPEDVGPAQDGTPHRLETAMQGMGREGLFERIGLRRLGGEDTAKIVESVLGETPLEAALLKRIHAETEGSPFFILEVVRHLVEDGVIGRAEGSWALLREPEDIDIPAKVHDVVQRRLNRLGNEQRELLECASVVGEEFGSDVVGRVSGLEKVRLLKGLSEIERSHGLVHYLDDRYRFDHSKVREVLYIGMGGELRREYHRLVAEALAELNEPDTVVSELAYHYYNAKDKRAPEYLVRAGDRAKHEFANDEAARLYRSALEVLGPEETRSVHESLGDVHTLTGEFDVALEHYEAALRLEADTKERAKVFKKVAVVHANKGDFQKSMDVCQEGLDLLGEEACIERAQLLESQGWAHVRTGDYEKASELLARCLEIAEGFGEKRVIAQAHHVIGSTSLNRGEFDDALEHLGTALGIREEIDDVKGQSATLNNMGVVYWNKGEVDEALEYYTKALDINEKMGHKWGISTALNNIGLVHSENGDLDMALEYYAQTLAMDRKLGDKSGIASALNNIGIIYSRKGENEEALDHHMRSLELREEIGDKTGIASSHINLGNVCNAQDEFEKAVEHFGKSLAIATEMGDKWLLGHIHFSLAVAVLELGDVEKAHEHAKKGLELSTAIGAKKEEAMCHSALGMIHRERKKWDESAEEFERSWAILEEVGDRTVMARMLYDYGLMRKASGETDKAKELLGRSLAISREMGMKPWQEKAGRALEDLG